MPTLQLRKRQAACQPAQADAAHPHSVSESALAQQEPAQADEHLRSLGQMGLDVYMMAHACSAQGIGAAGGVQARAATALSNSLGSGPEAQGAVPSREAKEAPDASKQPQAPAGRPVAGTALTSMSCMTCRAGLLA